MRSRVTSVFLCACESWTLTAELQRRIKAMETRYYRRILRISYKDHVTNEEVHAKIQQTIRTHDSYLLDLCRYSLSLSPDHRKETQTAVVGSCLPFIRTGQNHLARHSERGNKTRQTEEEVGRQNQGMDRRGVHQVPEGVKNRDKWRKLYVKSSVVPQRPPRSRDL